MADWYLKFDDGSETGPISEADFRELISKSIVKPETNVRTAVSKPWSTADKVKGIQFPASVLGLKGEPKLDAPTSQLPPALPSDSEKDCPFCAERIKANAVKCKHCGEFLQQLTNTQSQQSVFNASTVPNLTKIVEKQKLVIWTMLFGLIVEIPLFVFLVIVPVLGFPLLLVYLGFRTVVAIQLGLACFKEPVIAVFLGLLTLIPFFGLLVLLIINGQATATLQRFGVTVGLMGGDRIQAMTAQNNLK